MPTINYLEPFTALADVYQAAGFAQYSANLAPHLLEYAFDLEWTGRSLYAMACGTGECANWFSEHGFRVIGVDSSSQMLRHATAHANSRGLSVEFIQGDIRTYECPVQVEMVTSLGGSLNYIPALRDLESVFRQAYTALAPGKLFFFDMYTIQGLSRPSDTDRVIYDNNNDIMIIERETFSYETLLLTRQYTIFMATDKGWQRAEETHVLRGYPVQAIISTLSKVGFKVLRTLTPDLQPAENQRDVRQMLFIAAK